MWAGQKGRSLLALHLEWFGTTCGISCMLRGGCGLLSTCSSVWPCTITWPLPIPLLDLLSPLPLTLSQGGVTEPALCLSPPRRHHSHSHPRLPLTSHPLPPSQRHCLPGWSTHRCAGQSHHTAFVSLRPPSPPHLVHYSLCFLPSLPPPPASLHLFIHPLPFPSLLIIPPSLPPSLFPSLPPSLPSSLPPSLPPSFPPSLLPSPSQAPPSPITAGYSGCLDRVLINNARLSLLLPEETVPQPATCGPRSVAVSHVQACDFHVTCALLPTGHRQKLRDHLRVGRGYKEVVATFKSTLL